LVGDVTFTQHNELLGIHYETDAAAYSVYIPGCDEKANRYRTGLIKYKLQLAEPDPTEKYCDQSDEEIGDEFNEPA
jgi:NADH:ubiquinone oxidoreductase subunit B-like Fe-S oxidoreductase